MTNRGTDRDYIDPPSERADVFVDGEEIDEHERNPQQIPAERHKSPPHKSVDLSHTFGRMEGDGSGSHSDVQIDARKATERDDRGGKTGMDTSEASGFYDETIVRDGKRRSRAEWLLLLNNGYRSKQRKSENEQADNERWIDTFTSRLDMTEYQTERVKTIIDSVNMKHFGHYTVEMIVLAAITLAAQADGRMIRDERTFHQLVIDTDTSMKTINRIRELLREKSDLLDEIES